MQKNAIIQIILDRICFIEYITFLHSSVNLYYYITCIYFLLSLMITGVRCLLSLICYITAHLLYKKKPKNYLWPICIV